MARAKRRGDDPATKAFRAGEALVFGHPMFRPFRGVVWIHREERNRCPEAGWAIVTSNGAIHVHPRRRGAPEEWAWILAHGLLHLGFEHFAEHPRWIEWNTACCGVVARFLQDLKLGRPPASFDLESLPPTEERLYRHCCERGIPPGLAEIGTAGPRCADMQITSERTAFWRGKPPEWKRILAEGIAASVTSAVNVAAGREAFLGAEASPGSAAARARSWLISSYPLLGSLAAAFRLVEDPKLCQRLDVSVAMVDEDAREIYVNPAGLQDEFEYRFVLAHEFLHVGLRHVHRRAGRDAFLWNVACDFAVNAWLVEMGVGELPRAGVLYDPELQALSAEAIYDRIVTDLRRFRRLRTLRGNAPDMADPGCLRRADGMDLDEFYRRCLLQGLAYHEANARGLLPGGLVEEIRALDHPPIPWDVELARWFDRFFAPVEMRRSYARSSRRQSATPDIPRPRWIPAPHALDGRTFGVVLDTSGSMERGTLAKALGAIASYSMSRDVPAVRVVFCDAAAYDAGYMAPEAIADSVRVKGRGGTVLQPGIDLLERALDFPPEGPLLVITDGECDRLQIRREHAFLLPQGKSLPFQAKGAVFYIG